MVKTFKHLHDKDVRARDMMYSAPQRKAAFSRDASSGLNSSAHLVHAVRAESIMVPALLHVLPVTHAGVHVYDT